MSTEISAEFPFESKFIDIKESNMHYIEEGEGDPILFLHGQPTSSYLWRNIIPHVKPRGRCIAPDLIGMGKSGKPDIDYTYEDHYEYVEAFIEQMGLKDITLVIHDWGSGLGFHYAHLNPDNVKRIVFMEAIIKTMKWEDFPSDYKMMFKLIRAPYIGWFMLSVLNIFVNKVLPDTIVRKLTDEEMDRYREPFPTIASRKPVRMWPTQVPISGKPQSTHDKISAYAEWLKETEIPKLCFYAKPGAIIMKREVEYLRKHYKNTEFVELGKGLHFIQEDHPHQIGQEIAKWLSE